MYGHLEIYFFSLPPDNGNLVRRPSIDIKFDVMGM